MRVLLLGGTSEAVALARALARLGADAIVSHRAAPRSAPGPGPSRSAQALRSREGGFGGVAGLVAYLADQAISHVIDATDPFASRMSRNAFVACARQDLPLIRLERPAWQAQAGDTWICHPDLTALPAALPDSPARVFLALDTAHLDLFITRPQHRYLLRLADAPSQPLPLPRATVVLAPGPFDPKNDAALMRTHAITHVVTRNTGGRSEGAKLAAARSLGLPVLLAQRPLLPGTEVAHSTAEVLDWLHRAPRAARG